MIPLPVLLVEDENKFTPPFFTNDIPEIRKMEEIRPCGLIYRIILLHDFADGEVFVALLHHCTEDVAFPLADIRYFPDDGFCCDLLGLFLFQVMHEIFFCIINARQVIEDEIGEIHLIILGIEVRERVFLLRPEDDPGDGHVLEQPVSPR